MSKWKKIMPIALAVFMCATFANGTSYAADVSESADSSVETTITDENTTEETLATDEDTTEEAVAADESTSEEVSSEDEATAEEPTVTTEGEQTIGSHKYLFTYPDGKEGLAHQETYTGQMIEMEPNVKVWDTVNSKWVDLYVNTQYLYLYPQNCTNVGTAYVEIKGISTTEYMDLDYLMPYTIVAAPISSATVTMPQSSYVYTGAAITPKPTLTYRGITLKEGTDYTLSYSSNKAVGTAKMTITGTKNFTGSITKTFTISKASMSSNCTISLSTSKYAYNGKAKKPKVVVKNKVSGKTVPTSNYSVSYSSNKNPGYAKIKVKAKSGGNYTGSVSTTFQIVPKAVRLTSVKKSGSYVSLKWTSSKKAKKYIVYRRTTSSGQTHYTQIATTKKTSYVDKEVSVGRTYRYCIKAASSNIVSKSSNAKSIKLTLTGSSISSVTKGSGYIRIRWTKVSGATRYIVYKKRNGGSWSALYTSTARFSYDDSSVISGVTYSYKVVTYFDDTTVTSSAKSVTYTSGSSDKMSAPSGFSVSQKGASKVFYASWNSVSGVTGYEVVWSTSSSFGSKHFYPTSRTSFYPSATACGSGTWYVKVRGVNAATGRYTDWSSTRSVTIR